MNDELDYRLPNGAMVSKYRVTDLLGVGGFGITYKAENTAMVLTVALKEYLPQDLAARRHEVTTVVAKTNCSNDFEYGLNKFLE